MRKSEWWGAVRQYKAEEEDQMVRFELSDVPRFAFFLSVI